MALMPVAPRDNLTHRIRLAMPQARIGAFRLGQFVPVGGAPRDARAGVVAPRDAG